MRCYTAVWFKSPAIFAGLVLFKTIFLLSLILEHYPKGLGSGIVSIHISLVGKVNLFIGLKSKYLE